MEQIQTLGNRRTTSMIHSGYQDLTLQFTSAWEVLPPCGCFSYTEFIPRGGSAGEGPAIDGSAVSGSVHCNVAVESLP
jgi:hypothetical protein